MTKDAFCKLYLLLKTNFLWFTVGKGQEQNGVPLPGAQVEQSGRSDSVFCEQTSPQSDLSGTKKSLLY